MLEFVFGAVIGHVYSLGRLDRLGAAVGWSMMVIATAFILPTRPLFDASCALYLTHLASIGLLRIVWIELGIGADGVPWTLVFVGAALVTSIAMALPAYRLLEQPLTHAAQRMLENRVTTANA